MEALYLLIPLSVVAVFAAAWIFLRMSDSGQFDDMDGPAWSVLHDDDRPAHEDKDEHKHKEGGEDGDKGQGESEGAGRSESGQAGETGGAPNGPPTMNA